MTRMNSFAYRAALVILLSTWSVAQTKSTMPPSATSPGSTTTGLPTTTGSTTGRKGNPCWEKAGVPSSVGQQRRQIEQNTHAQVESVCADSSLTAQQKHEKIRELRAQAHQQTEALLTPEQRQAVSGCRREHGERSAGGHSGHGGGGAGPCGETASTTSGRSMQESDPDQ